MRRTALLVSIAIALTSNAGFAASNSIRGTPCKKIGATKTLSGYKYTCTGSGKRLVWSKGVLIKPSMPSTTSSPRPTPAYSLSESTSFNSTNSCQLVDTTRPTPAGLISTGFPNKSPLHSKNKIKVLALLIDYPDYPASDKTLADVREVSDGVNRFYQTISYGKLDFEWQTSSDVYRMPREISFYNLNRQTYASPFRLGIFMQDAISAADHNIDFSSFDYVALFSPHDVPYTLNGTYAGTRSGIIKISSREGQLLNIQTQPSLDRWNTYQGRRNRMINNWAGLAHEIGHDLGLMDLYWYDKAPEETHISMPDFDYMANLWGGLGPEPIGWHRWLLGFLNDSQVLCSPVSYPITAKLGAIEVNGDEPKILVIPISNTQAIVIESRRPIGYDSLLTTALQGVFVYQIDTSIKTGQGPITSLRVGLKATESFSVGSLKVRILESTTYADVIEVTRGS